jgi:hypothetical protein
MDNLDFLGKENRASIHHGTAIIGSTIATIDLYAHQFV